MLMSDDTVLIVIPAYKPDRGLIKLVKELSSNSFSMVIVDDGSGDQFAPIFSEITQSLDVILLSHSVNMGKGQALKTAFNYVLKNLSTNQLGVITADADGQHLISDIKKISTKFLDNPDCMILGSRNFEKNTPFKSQLGNIVTRKIFWLVSGMSLQDTQTGLRAIPVSFLPECLALSSMRYDFELDMLILVADKRLCLIEEKIQTIYHNNNSASHFNPIVDSLKIYFIFVRYASVAILCGLIDYIGFIILFTLTGDILKSESIARSLSGILNFVANRNLVFKSSSNIGFSIIGYVALTIINIIYSYSLISFLIYLGVDVYISKAIALIMMSLINFSVQNSIIFRNKSLKHH